MLHKIYDCECMALKEMKIIVLSLVVVEYGMYWTKPRETYDLQATSSAVFM